VLTVRLRFSLCVAVFEPDVVVQVETQLIALIKRLVEGVKRRPSRHELKRSRWRRRQFRVELHWAGRKCTHLVVLCHDRKSVSGFPYGNGFAGWAGADQAEEDGLQFAEDCVELRPG